MSNRQMVNNLPSIPIIKQALKTKGYLAVPHAYNGSVLQEIQEAVLRLCLNQDERDFNQDRVKSGYTTQRWDITTNLENQFASLQSMGLLTNLLAELHGSPVCCEEAMVHKSAGGVKSGINWHTESGVSTDKTRVSTTIIVYPFSAIGPASSVEILTRGQVQQDPEAEHIIVAPEEGLLVFLAPDIVHRVPEGIPLKDRFSIVCRYYRV